MTSYPLHFSSDGQQFETFQVPEDKVVYLTRAEQVSTGTATVQDLLTRDEYVLKEGVTVMRTNIPVGAKVSLCFNARTNERINLVLAEVTWPR